MKQKNLFFDTQSSEQSTLALQLIDNFRNNNLLARSILSGTNLCDKEKFEEDIWFDLDQTRRQAKINGKPYRDIALYANILKPLQATYKELQAGIAKYDNSFRLAEKLSIDLFAEKTCIKTIINELNTIFSDEEDSTLKKMIQDYILIQGVYFDSPQEEEDIQLYGYHYLPPHREKFRLWCEEQKKSLTDGESKMLILNNYGIKEHFYQTCINSLNDIKQQGKEKQILLDEKLSAQQQIREYLQYRNTKNEIHTFLNFFFPHHRRKNSITLERVETDCQYFTGYKLSLSEISVVKTALPSIPVNHEHYNPRNRVTGNVDKVIATPASWTYIYSDIPIQLFSGRKGDITFTLIGLDENLISIINSHKDISSTSFIIPQGLQQELIQQEFLSKEAVYQQKKTQYQTMLNASNKVLVDHWFNKETLTSGHTESVIYGAPAGGGIIIHDGWEDIAWEARKRYSALGFIECNAPFFLYDPHTGLTHVSDEQVYQKALDCSLKIKHRITYNPFQLTVNPLPQEAAITHLPSSTQQKPSKTTLVTHSLFTPSNTNIDEDLSDFVIMCPLINPRTLAKIMVITIDNLKVYTAAKAERHEIDNGFLRAQALIMTLVKNSENPLFQALVLDAYCSKETDDFFITKGDMLTGIIKASKPYMESLAHTASQFAKENNFNLRSYQKTILKLLSDKPKDFLESGITLTICPFVPTIKDPLDQSNYRMSCSQPG